MTTGRFSVSPAVAATMADLGVPAGRVLQAAGLPEDLFRGPQVLLTQEQFYRCWTALEALAGDPAIGATLAARISTETFQPAIFAALCSPDLRHATERVATHKRLLGPQQMAVDADTDQLRVSMRWPPAPPPPPSFVAYEVAFVVALARLGTRTRVTPLSVRVPDPPAGAAAEAYADFLGVRIRRGSPATVAFTGLDARRPFLTANAELWQLFEPDLRRRLGDLDRSESTADRVRAALNDLLPAGEATAAGVARRLAVSSRTLQRRLAEEGTTFQAVLERTRLHLARHYLNRPDVTMTEIAFLLGYDEPSSFHRAFHQWSGTTPQQARSGSIG
ncbi:AraC family transcriptional regulator [Actinoplanes sp. N902-109]|uniref:helix-turn-helix transcriptional regulator n=1 Tax=Actinoplanes sp. (strain N902-109) TaxID=649831 RepID=UPI0003295AE5|nr:AraC family transcriptional regulator [Actinoplanes sp. N902-109]AGL18380.1 AraC family transcriptional regulator [Actinoplanes sp. N902-109]